MPQGFSSRTTLVARSWRQSGNVRHERKLESDTLIDFEAPDGPFSSSMERRLGGVLTAVAVIAALLLTVHPATTRPAAGAEAVITMPQLPTALAGEGFAKSLIRQVRSTFRLAWQGLWITFNWWGSSIQQAGFSLGVVAVAALADGGLLNAWRLEGLRTLFSYSLLTLYVYARLLFSGGVTLMPKLFLVGALIYGVMEDDLVPDDTIIPGRLEDIALIVIATRTFVYACPAELVNEYANRAVTLKGGVLAMLRARAARRAQARRASPRAARRKRAS